MQTASSPVSIAGDPLSKADVCVGPPWSDSGPSLGSVLLMEPLFAPHLQLVPLSRLWPPLMIPPAQLLPLGLFATMVLARVSAELSRWMPPPDVVAELPENVLFVNVTPL